LYILLSTRNGKEKSREAKSKIWFSNKKTETKRVRYLMPNEVQFLLSNCDGLLRGLLRPLVTVAVHTGARKGELQSLQPTGEF
jgi:integrase